MGVRGRVLRGELRGGVGIGFVVALEYDFLQEQHWKVKPPAAPAPIVEAPSENVPQPVGPAPQESPKQPIPADDTVNASDEKRNADEAPINELSSTEQELGAEPVATEPDQPESAESQPTPPPPPPSPPPPPEPHAGMVVLCEIGNDGDLIRVTPAGEFAVEGPITAGKLVDEDGHLIVQVPFGVLDEKQLLSPTEAVVGMTLDCTFDGHGRLASCVAVPEPRRGVVRKADAKTGTFEVGCLSAENREENWRLHSGLASVKNLSAFQTFAGTVAEHWRGLCPPAVDMVVDVDVVNGALMAVRPATKHWIGVRSEWYRRGRLARDRRTGALYVAVDQDVPPEVVKAWPEDIVARVGLAVACTFLNGKITSMMPAKGAPTQTAILKWTDELHLASTRYEFSVGEHWKSNDIPPIDDMVVDCTVDPDDKLVEVRPVSDEWNGLPKDTLHPGKILVSPKLPFWLDLLKVKELVTRIPWKPLEDLIKKNEVGMVDAEFEFTRNHWEVPAPLPRFWQRVWCKFDGDVLVSLHTDDGAGDAESRDRGRIRRRATDDKPGVVVVDGKPHPFTASQWRGMVAKPRWGSKVYCTFNSHGRLETISRKDDGGRPLAHVTRISGDDGAVAVEFEFNRTQWQGAGDSETLRQGLEVNCEFDEAGNLSKVRPMPRYKRSWVAFTAWVVTVISLLSLVGDMVSAVDSKGLKASHLLRENLHYIDRELLIEPIAHFVHLVRALWHALAWAYTHLRDFLIDWAFCLSNAQYLPTPAYKNLLILSALAVIITAAQASWRKEKRHASAWKVAQITLFMLIAHGWYLSGWMFEFVKDPALLSCNACHRPCPPVPPPPKITCTDGRKVDKPEQCCPPIPPVPTKAIQQATATLYFAYNDAVWNGTVPDPQNKANNTEGLKKIIAAINSTKNPKVIITGHTDTVGSDEFNFHLAQNRAETVRCVLFNLMTGSKDFVPKDSRANTTKACKRTDGVTTAGLNGKPAEDGGTYDNIKSAQIVIQATAFTNMQKPTALDQKEGMNRRVMVVVISDPAKK